MVKETDNMQEVYHKICAFCTFPCILPWCPVKKEDVPDEREHLDFGWLPDED